MRDFKRRLIPALVLLLALPAVLPAAKKAPSFEYLTVEQRNFDFPPPPAAGSPEYKADFDLLREWEKKRTPEQCAEADAEAHATFDEFFGKMSPLPNPLPRRAAKIVKRMGREASASVWVLKDRFNRPRPFHTDAELHPCLGRIGGLAYPSGHATLSRMYALILSELAPERRAEFIARADEAALFRIIGGVHHPSDIEAGKRLAESVFAMCMKNPAFVKDMETLRGYIKKPVAAR
ncbi:MAG TPA: phosphatase PAP2 family protein [Elusimicrobiales bacterium]|nr:phosphatase PAP2 family protein [Elusimicrobiales bacterium]